MAFLYYVRHISHDIIEDIMIIRKKLSELSDDDKDKINQLGALAYIKSTINPYKYHLHGVSGGSWCSLMYHLEDNLNDHDKLWNRYIGNESTVIKLYDMKSMETVHKSITKNVME